MALIVFLSPKRRFQIDRGPAYFKCHGEKEMFICFSSGNQTRIAGLLDGRSPSELAGPGVVIVVVLSRDYCIDCLIGK